MKENGNIISIESDNEVPAHEDDGAINTEPEFRKLTEEEKTAINKKITDIEESLSSYGYVLDVSDEVFDKYFTFLYDSAKFKGRESMGIIELHEILEKCKKTKEISKAYSLKNTELEALYFFLVNYEGKGYAEASMLHELLSPVHNTYERAVIRRKKSQAMANIMQGQIQGLVDPDAELPNIE